MELKVYVGILYFNELKMKSEIRSSFCLLVYNILKFGSSAVRAFENVMGSVERMQTCRKTKKKAVTPKFYLPQPK